MERTPDKVSERQGKVLLPISQLDIFHACFIFVFLLFPFRDSFFWITISGDTLMNPINPIPQKLCTYTKQSPVSEHLRPLEAPLGD